MATTRTLRRAIAECLQMCQGIETLEGRKALIARASLDDQLARRITYGGSARVFCRVLVSDLDEYGRLQDGRHAVRAIVEAARGLMDSEWARHCDLVLADLKFQLAIFDALAYVRDRWHIVLSGLCLCVLLWVVAGRLLPVLGQPRPEPVPVSTPTAQPLLAPSIAPSPTPTALPASAP